MNMNEELGRLRSMIDMLDDQMLELVERRIEAARAIAAVKGEGDAKTLKLRPRREAEVVERLAAKASPASRRAVRHIWRELMGHCLQVQARTDIAVVATDARLDGAVRQAFGSAPRLLHVANAAEALRLADEEGAVAVLPAPLPPLPPQLGLVRAIRGEEGEEIAYAVGRLPAEERIAGQGDWTPASWRSRTISQMPAYPDPARLARVETELSAAAQVVGIDCAMELKREIAEAAEGRAILLQGGDCAEGFDAFSAEQVRANHALLLELGRLLPVPVVHVARAAGQFAKPRSSATEIHDGVAIPSYRGDAVHGAEPTARARIPDPERLLRVHRQSLATMGLIGSLDALSSARRAARERVYVSHEALLLPYEQALTRRDGQTGRWWATSGHMVWIGERTRDLDGAHVEYARGIANTIGLKCGPSMSADELMRLIDRLDPGNEAGRLVLIGRFGAEHVARTLPSLMRATRQNGRKALWIIDPMHGNGRVVEGRKTRLVEDLKTELRDFVEIAGAEGVHAGGLHLEMTAAPVTECLGGRASIRPDDLGRRYESLCDPRLNREQSREVVAFSAACLSAQARGQAWAA